MSPPGVSPAWPRLPLAGELPRDQCSGEVGQAQVVVAGLPPQDDEGLVCLQLALLRQIVATERRAPRCGGLELDKG